MAAPAASRALAQAAHLQDLVARQKSRGARYDSVAQWKLSQASLTREGLELQHNLTRALAALQLADAEQQMCACNQEVLELQHDLHAEVLATISADELAASAPGSLQEDNTSCEVDMMLVWLKRQAASLQQEAATMQRGIKRSHASLSQPSEPPEEMLAREFDELVAGSSASPSCVDQLQDGVLALFHELLQEDYAPCSSAPSDSGWSPEEHAAFVHHRREALATGQVSTQAVAHFLESRLPSKAAREIAAHEAWYQAHRQHSMAATTAQQHKLRLCREFLAHARAQLAAAALQQAQAERQRAEHEMLAAKRGKLHTRLDELQEERSVQEAAQAAADAKQAMVLQAEQAERQAAMAQERKEMKERISAYRKTKEQEEADRAAEAAEQAYEAARQVAAAAPHRHERITFRLAKLSEKDLARQARAAAAEEEELARQQRLEKLRLTVAVEVDADPERAMGPTASTLAEAPDPDGQAFIPLHGFTVKDLRRDQRFRVAELLHRQGLHGTAAGKAALQAARPAVPMRADTRTSEARLLG